MKKIIGAITLFFFWSSNALACACGCGILNVGTSTLLPSGTGGIAFLQYDQLNQSRNWSDDSRSNGHNHDKAIETQTITAGAQYMFSKQWGAALRVPYVTRYVNNVPHQGGPTYDRHSDVGDVRLNGIYSGFFDDMSTGLIFGLKLPTGQKKAAGFERNTQIGSGSTDSILGAFHRGNFSDNFGYFTQVAWERPFATYKGYTPGQEVSYSGGVFYNLGQVGKIQRVAPIMQITGAKKAQDHGWNDPSHNLSSGYHQVFFAPGIEVTIKSFKVYADVEFPIYRSVNGNQLVPQNLYKIILGYTF